MGRPSVRTNACKVPDADANTPDDVTALMNVQVNRCVVETQRYDENHSLTDQVVSDLPVTLKVEQQVNCNVDQLVKNDDELFCGKYGSVHEANT